MAQFVDEVALHSAHSPQSPYFHPMFVASKDLMQGSLQRSASPSRHTGVGALASTVSAWSGNAGPSAPTPISLARV